MPPRLSLFSLAAWLALAMGLSAIDQDSNPPRAKDPIRERLDRVKPRLQELWWKSLPWQTSLKDAYKVAREQKKPIFLLCTDGDLESANC